MTAIRLTTAAGDLAPDARASERTGAPLPTVIAPMPAIEAGPILMRAPQGRQAIPGFDGDSGEPFDIADLVRQVEDAGNAAVRASSDTRPDIWPGTWPDVQPAPRRRAAGPERAVDDPWRELAARRSEFANAQEIQTKQAAALRRARDEIVSLDDATKLLSAKLTQQEKEKAAAQRALQRSDDEKAALRAELEQTNANFTELLKQTGELKAAFNQREKEIAAVHKSVTSLKAELSAKAGETDLTAAIEEAKSRYYNDFSKRYAQFEAQVEKLARMVGARDERIRNLEDENTTLAARCEVLAEKAAALESAKQNAEERLETQTAIAAFLETTLQAERESTGQKIAELVADLRHERLERAADARESATVCKQIVQLLPKLAGQQDRALDSIARAARSAASAAE